MILTVMIHDEQRHAETAGEADLLISNVLESLKWGDNAWFTLDRQSQKNLAYADSTLMVSINKSTGYGGVVWHVSTGYPRQGGIYDFTWVSDNPLPPAFDPKVLSDSHTPVYMAPASVLPMPEIRKVLTEYCHNRTGDRPGCIDWVKGHMNGHRIDEVSYVNPESEASIRTVRDGLMRRFGNEGISLE